MPQQHQQQYKKNKLFRRHDFQKYEEEVPRITQINKTIPDGNDYYSFETKIYGSEQNLTNDTGSPVTIMPNNPKVFNMVGRYPTDEGKIPDGNKNEIYFLGKVSVDIEYNNTSLKLPLPITKRNGITH